MIPQRDRKPQRKRRMREKTIDQLDRLLQDFLQTLKESAMPSVNGFVAYLKEAAPDYVHALGEEIWEIVKIAWNYEEYNTREYGFGDAIAWIRERIDPQRHGGACLYRTSTGEYFTLYMCLLDREERPLLGASDPYCVVHCLALDEQLVRQFGTKNMIIVK